MRPGCGTLFVWTGGPCSNGCGACPIDQGTAEPAVQPADLSQALGGAPSNARRLVVLVGGEPILRPDLLHLLAAIRAAGCMPGIVTTGRPLTYPQVRTRLRRAGLAYARIQLFGVGESHDQATAVPGGFEQALAGLQAWIAEAGDQCDVDVALNLRRRSPDALVTEVEHLAREIVSPHMQIVVAIDADLEPRHRESLRRAAGTLARWNDDPSRPLLAWQGLPDSLAPASCLTLPSLRPAFITTTPRASCLGALPGMATAAHAALRQTQANSFNFVRTAESVPWTAAADACTAHAAAGGRDRLRHLWLIEGDRLIRYETDTGDFDSAEIARIKDDWSHLYLDRAPVGVLDDFTEGMRRLLVDPTCTSCAHRDRCGHRFGVVEGPPFAREEAWIGDYISGLRGRVLDVGCGEQLYPKVLAPLLSSRVVDYTGLDPDEISLNRIRTALPEGRFHLGGIEDFRGEPQSYDCILCLRSLNHVVDLDEAVSRMTALLKPGGELLIVETTPFALLRRADQVAAADQAPRAGHQHFRNLTSDEVLPLARRRKLLVAHHHPARLSTANEWILLLRRSAGPAS
jgi:2-polyprenyl-3-methyl-5-hydroxy-6-metoxy-1,4-benzoquinol methylase